MENNYHNRHHLFHALVIAQFYLPGNYQMNNREQQKEKVNKQTV
jgi:hypothetical protein